MPEQVNYPEVIADVVARLVSGDRAGADRSMADIAHPKGEMTKRPPLPRPLMIRIFRRDCWTCRYCGARTIFYPVMPLLGVIFPEHFPYHTNWKAGHTHPAVVTCSSIVDHVVPGALGGAWREKSNLVTACWPCNARKGDLTLEQLHWQLRPVQESSWDGLTGFYRQLWEIAGSPTADAHPLWLRALSDATSKGTGSTTSGPAFDPLSAPPDVRELIEKMDDLAGELGLIVRSARTGRNYQPPVLESGVRFKSGIGVFSTRRGAEFNLSVFRDLGANEVADGLLQRLREVTGMQVDAPAWPAVPCRALIANWDLARSQLILPYFDARRELVREDSQTST